MTPRRCCYPNCVLEEHETGEHRFGRPEKPWGELRQTQEFRSSWIPCDMEHPIRIESALWYTSARAALTRATAFYVDMLGFGWALCPKCSANFTMAVAEETKAETQTRAPSSETPSVSSAIPVATNRPAKLLAFTRSRA